MFDRRKYRETYRKQHAEQLRQQAKAYYEKHRSQFDDEATKERKRENARRYRKTKAARDVSRKWDKQHPTPPAYYKAHYQERLDRVHEGVPVVRVVQETSKLLTEVRFLAGGQK